MGGGGAGARTSGNSFPWDGKGSAGAANTGGGGGGGDYEGTGGAGGSGTVILRYTVSSSQYASTDSASISYIDTILPDSFTTMTGILLAADSEGTTLSYAVSGGSTSEGFSTKVGSYGSLKINAASGAYTFVPNAAAINALNTDTAETYVLGVSDGATTSTASYTVNIAAVKDAPSGLVGYWKMNEGSGTTVADSSGNGLNASFVGAAANWYGTGAPNTAGNQSLLLNYGTSGSYLRVADTADKLDFNAAGGFTISSWVYQTDAANNAIVDHGDYNFLLQVAPNGQSGLGFYNNATGWKYSATAIPTYTWVYTTATWDKATGLLKFYKDGALTDTFSGVSSIYQGGSNVLTIGQQSPDTCACNTFNGLLDDVMLFNRALDQTTIQYLMGGAVTPLILDLNGDGVRTVASNPGVSFDMAASGRRTTYGWVSAQDGLLVRDLNGDGMINDGSELFGEGTTMADGSKAKDGFAALSAMDANQDGVVDGNDAQFTELRIWQDSNSDGVTQPGELSTLEDRGISALTLAAQTSDRVDNGNRLGLVSGYTTADGETHEMADVWFSEQHDVKVSAQPAAAAEQVSLTDSVGGLVDAIGAFDRWTDAEPEDVAAQSGAKATLQSVNSAPSLAVSNLADLMRQFDSSGALVGSPTLAAAALANCSALMGLQDPSKNTWLTDSKLG